MNGGGSSSPQTKRLGGERPELMMMSCARRVDFFFVSASHFDAASAPIASRLIRRTRNGVRRSKTTRRIARKGEKAHHA
jgi:hypothetical protein